MKQILLKLLTPDDPIIASDLIDSDKLHEFRVRLLLSILLTASIAGVLTGLLEYLDILPASTLYTPIVLLYGVLNFVSFLLLRSNPAKYYLPVMHLCIFLALATLGVMSASLIYDEFRFVWFFLFSFAAYILGGKRYGITFGSLVLLLIYTEYAVIDLRFSPFALFSFTFAFVVFNLFAIVFLGKIEQDARILQTCLAKESKKHKSKEALLQKIHAKDTMDLKQGFVWDRKLKQLTYNNEPIPLTQKEQKLLSLLIEHANRCVTFEEIQVALWGDQIFEKDITIASVKTQVTALRKKLPKEYIKNVYGCGYTLHL